MSEQNLEALRSQIDGLNLEILRLINERAEVVNEIGKIKEKQGVNRYDPLRERHMLNLLRENNKGPLNQMTVDYIFKQIFKTALKQLEAEKKKNYLYHVRKSQKILSLISMENKLVPVLLHSYLVLVLLNHMNKLQQLQLLLRRKVKN